MTVQPNDTAETLRMKDIHADWLVIAAVCACGHVAATIMATDMCDPDASAEADDDNEVVAYGDDWRALILETTAAMHERTGLRISAMCTVVYTRECTENLRDHGKLAPFENEVSEFMYSIDTRGERK